MASLPAEKVASVDSFPPSMDLFSTNPTDINAPNTDAPKF